MLAKIKYRNSQVFAKIDNFCVKGDIMGRDCSRVEGKRRRSVFHTQE